MYDTWYGKDLFRITPLNFNSALPVDYEMQYTFQNSTGLKLGLQLSTANGTSLSIASPSLKRYYDTDDVAHVLQLGETQRILISPRKYKYLKSLGCLQKSRNEILLQRMLDLMGKNCQQPCKDKSLNFGHSLNVMLATFPQCKDLIQVKCFWKSINKVIDEGLNDSKPCIRVEYKGEETTYNDQPQNKGKYLLLFSNPPKVVVGEEYLIYDGVALISALGGTMGLCIGFSFYNLAHVVFEWMALGILKALKNGKKQVNPSNHSQILNVSKSGPDSKQALDHLSLLEDRLVTYINTKTLTVETEIGEIRARIDHLMQVMKDQKDV